MLDSIKFYEDEDREFIQGIEPPDLNSTQISEQADESVCLGSDVDILTSPVSDKLSSVSTLSSSNSTTITTTPLKPSSNIKKLVCNKKKNGVNTK